MKVEYLEFPSAGTVQLKTTEIDELPNDTEVLVRTALSLVSPGRELSAYNGKQFAKVENVKYPFRPCPGRELSAYNGKQFAKVEDVKYPFRPGSVTVGEVLKTGEKVSGLDAGDLVLTTTNHCSACMLDSKRHMIFKIPPNIHPEDALFFLLGIISIVPVRVAQTEVGRRVAVVGLGLTGNITAQLFAASGVEVTGVDATEKRVQEAIACGIGHTINASQEDIRAKRNFLTDEHGYDTVVCDASNHDALDTCFELARDRGEVILMTPIERHPEFDFSGHIYRRGISLKGAHPSLFRRKSDNGPGWDVSKYLNLLIKHVREGKLKFRRMITHRTQPSLANTAYKGLLNTKQEYLGVVFQWG